MICATHGAGAGAAHTGAGAHGAGQQTGGAGQQSSFSHGQRRPPAPAGGGERQETGTQGERTEQGALHGRFLREWPSYPGAPRRRREISRSGPAWGVRVGCRGVRRGAPTSGSIRPLSSGAPAPAGGNVVALAVAPVAGIERGTVLHGASP